MPGVATQPATWRPADKFIVSDSRLALAFALVAFGGGFTLSSTGGFSSGSSLTKGDGLLLVGWAGLDLSSLARSRRVSTD